ncbi:tetratricopeptide repeat protein [bacterium]|nr:tetratricopeptide repeat protein [bacterium]
MFNSRNKFIVSIIFIIGFSVLCAKNSDYSLWLELTPENSRQMAQWAESEYDGNNLDNAIRIYKTLLDNENVDVRNWSALWLGIIDSSFAKDIDFLPNSDWGTFFCAVKIKKNNPDSALTLLSQIVDSSKQDIAILLAKYWIGIIYRESEMAFRKWTEILDEYPKNFLAGELYYRLGKIRFDSGDYVGTSNFLSQAIDFYNSSLWKDRQWWSDEAYYLLAVSEIRQNNLDSASAVYNKFDSGFNENKYLSRIGILLSAYGDNPESALDLDSLPPSVKTDLLMRGAWSAMDRKKYRKAMHNFLDAYSIEQSDDAVIFAAECAYKLKDYVTAETLYQKIADARLKKYAQWGLGWTESRLESYAQAREIWSGLLDDSTFTDDAEFAIAKSYYYQRSLDSAQIKFVDYIQNFTIHYNEALFLLYFSQMENGDTAKAIETAISYLRKYPSGKKSELLAYNAATAMFERGSFSAVVDWVDSFSISFDKELGDSLVLLAERARYKLGDYNDPIQILTGFIERRPNSPLGPQLAVNMGMQFEQVHKWQDAIYVYSKAKESTLPGDTVWCEAMVGIIHSALNIGDTAVAGSALVSLSADGEMPWKALGKIYYAKWVWKNLGNSEQAISLYDDVINSKDAGVLVDSATLDLAGIYISAQMFPEARKILEDRWNSITHDDTMAMVYIKVISAAIWESGEPDSAVDFAINYADSAVLPCDVLYGIGSLITTDGRSELAGKIMDKMNLYGCSNLPAPFLLQMGEYMIQLERIPDACSLFAIVLSSHSDDSLGEVARERLKVFSTQKDTQ